MATVVGAFATSHILMSPEGTEPRAGRGHRLRDVQRHVGALDHARPRDQRQRASGTDLETGDRDVHGRGRSTYSPTGRRPAAHQA